MASRNTTRHTFIAIGIGVLLIGGALFGTSGHTQPDAGKAATVEHISAQSFMDTYHNTPGAVLIDVRTPAEYSAGHIARAINIDFENANFREAIQQLDPNTPYFIYCRSGNRSGQAATLMTQAGLKTIYDLRGGVSAAPQLVTEK